MYTGINIVTLAKRRLQLPDDGLCKLKHVGANIIVLNVLTIKKFVCVSWDKQRTRHY